MRFIPTTIHGVLDYAFGALLIATPWLLGFADWGTAHVVLVVFGLGSIGYALITDYELGVWKLLEMPPHLAIDVLVGLALVASPFFLGFQDQVIWPHLALGFFAMAAGAFTQSAPGYYPAHVLRV